MYAYVYIVTCYRHDEYGAHITDWKVFESKNEAMRFIANDLVWDSYHCSEHQIEL